MKILRKCNAGFADSVIGKSNESKIADIDVETDLQVAVLSILHQSGVLADNMYFKAARKITEGVR